MKLTLTLADHLHALQRNVALHMYAPVHAPSRADLANSMQRAGYTPADWRIVDYVALEQAPGWCFILANRAWLASLVQPLSCAISPVLSDPEPPGCPITDPLRHDIAGLARASKLAQNVFSSLPPARAGQKNYPAKAQATA